MTSGRPRAKGFNLFTCVLYCRISNGLSQADELYLTL